MVFVYSACSNRELYRGDLDTEEIVREMTASRTWRDIHVDTVQQRLFNDFSLVYQRSEVNYNFTVEFEEVNRFTPAGFLRMRALLHHLTSILNTRTPGARGVFNDQVYHTTDNRNIYVADFLDLDNQRKIGTSPWNGQLGSLTVFEEKMYLATRTDNDTRAIRRCDLTNLECVDWLVGYPGTHILDVVVVAY